MVTIYNFSASSAPMSWGTNPVVVPVGSWSYAGVVTDTASGSTISSGTVIYTANGVLFEPTMTPEALFGVGMTLGVALMGTAFLTAIARKVVNQGPSFAGD